MIDTQQIVDMFSTEGQRAYRERSEQLIKSLDDTQKRSARLAAQAKRNAAMTSEPQIEWIAL